MLPHTRISAAGAATCLALAGFAAVLPGTPAHAAGRSALPGSQPSWANAKALKGTAAAGDTVH
ncbi:MAG: hypothetical protein QOD70_925, partial [Frankiales bacterium]|nr:hypothetical protein [Frankiales bacterium]